MSLKRSAAKRAIKWLLMLSWGMLARIWRACIGRRFPTSDYGQSWITFEAGYSVRKRRTIMPGPYENAMRAVLPAMRQALKLARYESGLAQRSVDRSRGVNLAQSKKKRVTMPRDVLTPPEIGRRLGVSVGKVRGWVARG